MMLFINIKAVGNCGFSKEDFLMFSLQDFKLIYFSFNMEGIYFEAIADRQRLRYKWSQKLTLSLLVRWTKPP